ncbi:MAG: cation:proton antiporter [Bacteroidota bacterium]
MLQSPTIETSRHPIKGWKNILYYFLLIGGSIGGVFYVIKQGIKLQNASNKLPFVKHSLTGWKEFSETAGHNLVHPLAILLLQIITIILAAMAFGYLFRKLRQPAVIGEIIAGIVLGPSLVGYYFPEFSLFLFPVASLPNLQFLSQIGLILFMFVVGMELDLQVLKTKAYEAIVISHASIVIPFTFGIALAYFLYNSYAPAGVPFLPFSLFIGIAMSITAFPVLARIVQERQLSKTKLGALVITCAAADDITAWCLLAAVIAIVKAGSFISASYTILLAIVYVLLMVFVIRPFLKKVGDKYAGREKLSKPIVAVFFITLLVSSYIAELIGIHALFGAFMAGIIMPANASFRSVFIDKVEDVAVVLLLPLFFVFTGLRTQIALLNDITLWKACAGIIVIAVAGKFLGSALSARFVGQSWKNSLVIGALMNTRGLMELVVLNIGYDLGVLTPEIFAMMVIMALFTTFMTGPSLDLINFSYREKRVHSPATVTRAIASTFKILISFGTPDSGRAMLKLAAAFIKNSKENTSITALHLTPSSEVNQFNIDEKETSLFEPLLEEAEQLQLKVEKLFKPSQDIIPEVIRIANETACDLLLVGTSRSIYEGTFLGNLLGLTSKLMEPDKLYRTLTFQQPLFEQALFDERTQAIIDHAKVPLGVFINKQFSEAQKILLPVSGISDQVVFIYARKLITNNNAVVTLVDDNNLQAKVPEIGTDIEQMRHAFNSRVVLKSEEMANIPLDQFDLLLVSYTSWKNYAESKPAWLKNIPSTLIIRP